MNLLVPYVLILSIIKLITVVAVDMYCEISTRTKYTVLIVWLWIQGQMRIQVLAQSLDLVSIDGHLVQLILNLASSSDYRDH